MSINEIEDLYELSPTQQGILFHTLYTPESGVYVEQITYIIHGSIQIVALKAAWQEIMNRHSVLRTAFLWEEVAKPLQVVYRQSVLPWVYYDWRNIVLSELTARLAAFLSTDRVQGFDLSKPPAMRLIMIQVAADTYHFIWSFHHLLLDGWSVSLLLKQVFIHYQAFCQGTTATLERSRPYRDYIVWLQKQNMAAAEAFWRERLKGITAPTPLGLDRPSGSDGCMPGYAEQRCEIEPTTIGVLRELARQHRLTLNSLVQGAWALLLSYYSGLDDVLFGATISGRSPDLVGVEMMVGLFINTLPVRVHISLTETLSTWLQQLQNQQAEARQYEYSSLVQVQGWSQVPRGLPLFESIIVFENYPVEQTAAILRAGTNLRITDVRSLEQTNYPLTIAAIPEAGLILRVNYDSGRFSTTTIERTLGHLQTVLKGFADNPDLRLGELPLLTTAEQQQLAFWGHVRANYSFDGGIPQRFAAQVAQSSAAIALVCDGAHMTYQELNTYANQLAYHLRRLAVGTEVRVGLCIERSLELVVGLLGILKSGGAYVPLDIDYPAERLAFMLQDAQVAVLLTQSHLLTRLPSHQAHIVCLDRDWAAIAQEEAENLADEVRDDQLAYVIYTSGSTGQPKAVMVEHRNLLTTLAASQQFAFHSSDVMPWIASVSFDIALFELLNPLLAGARSIVLTRQHVLNLPGLCATLAQCSVFHTVPSLMQQIVRAITASGAESRVCPHVRMVFVGGDIVPPALLAEMRAVFPQADICILYGPTEATIICTHYMIPHDQHVDRYLIGTPLPYTQARLYDRHRRFVPVGVAGELYLGGASITRGYLNRPELTAELFVPAPYEERIGDGRWEMEGSLPIPHLPSLIPRLYRTGDLARYLPDGCLEFLGRVDQQVKVRGFRVELGEVEIVLSQHVSVREAVVLAHADAPGDARLVAYVELRTEAKGLSESGTTAQSTVRSPQPSLITDLRDFLKEKLPDYMVPSVFVVLDSLPLSAHGKLDRQAMPIPSPQRPNLDTTFVAPRTPQEQVIADIWAQVLGLMQVGIYDNFFTLGGHSLLATQVISRVRAVFNLEIPLRHIFESPTIAGLTEHVTIALGGPQRRSKPPLLPVGRDHALPLSFAQQRLWFLDLLQPGNPAYNMPVAVRLTGSLHVASLRRSLRAIVQRHEAVRTSFAMLDGYPVQVIAPLLNVLLVQLDLQGLQPECREVELERLASAEAQLPFDLSCGPLVRTTLVQLSATDAMLLLTMHHSISDGWSMSVAVRELATLYAAFVQGKPASLPDLPIQYADFAYWQRQWLQGAVLEEQLAYWKRQLGGSMPVLNLPFDRPPALVPIAHSMQPSQALSNDLTEKLKTLSRNEGVTPFMILLAAFNILLGRYTGQDDIVVGAPIANRNQSETEGLIGFFVNTLVLRTDLSGNPSFQELLGRVREMLLGAYAHQDLPFEKLVEELQPERSLERNPFFDVLFNFVNTPQTTLELPNLNLSVIERTEGSAKFWMTLYVIEQEGRFDLHVTYQPTLFSAEYITTMLRQFKDLLTQVVMRPQSPIQDYLLVPIDFPAPLPDPTAALCEPYYELVTTLFTDWVRYTPDHAAIAQGSRTWSYHTLSMSAHSLAQTLLAHDLQSGEAVAVFGTRSFGFIAGMLGVLLAGGAFLPVDCGLPIGRQRLMLQAANAKILLYIGESRADDAWLHDSTSLMILGVDRDTGQIVGATTPVQLAAIRLPEVLRDGAAYIFFTSGTTGVPKGVLGSHKGLSHFLTWQRETFGINPQDRVAQLTGLSFDVVLRDILLPLTSGATLCLPDDDGPLGADHVLTWLAREQVSLLHTVPALAETWLTNRTVRVSLGSLRWLFFAGEVLTDQLVQRWRTTFPEAGTIINLYGPTETTLAKCFYQIPGDVLPGTQPVGQPIPHTQALVLAHNNRLCGIGELGEIVLRTPFRSLGYLNVAEEQQQCFVQNPFCDDDRDLLYYTGDLGRYRPNGLLEVVGRFDQQIKIRGMRVELSEIEVLLREHPAVQQAAVSASAVATGDLRLVAYVVLAHDTTALSAELRRFLKEYLPAAMIPAAFVCLQSLPLTPNGKVDRRALPPDWQHPERDTEYVVPHSELEQTIAAVWQAALKIETVGVQDNFFDLGGHSLLIVQVHSKLQEQLDRTIPLVKLFQYPTVRALAAYIRQQHEDRAAVQSVQKSRARSELRKASMNRRRRGTQEN